MGSSLLTSVACTLSVHIILTSIHVVNCLNIVLPTCRYSKISLVYSKFFKLWPAYVHWARGNFHLAANDFASALPSFEGKLDIWCIMIIILPYLFLSGVEKAAILNEMGRMFIHSGDRHLASATFTKSNEVDLPLKDMDFRYQPSLVRFNVLNIFKCIKMCAKIYM